MPANSNTLEPAEVPEREWNAAGRTFDAAAYRRAVKGGMAALRNQDWAEAASQFQESLKLNPDSKEAAYNLGIAKFRQGDYAGAEELFKNAAQTHSADLAAKSMFNEGNSIYANAVKNLAQPKATSPAAPAGKDAASPPDLQKGIESVQKAFTHFKDASAANPQDDDSAVNAETSLKLLKQLKEEQKKQQQQQKQDQKKDQKQDKDQEQQQDQQNSDSKEDQQKQDQKQDPQKDQQQKPQQQQSQPDESKDQQQQQNQQKPDPQKSDQQKQDQKDQSSPQDDQKKEEEQQKKEQEQKDQQKNQPQDQQKQDQQKQDQQPDPKKPDEQKQDQTPAGQEAQAGADSKMAPQQTAQLLQLVRDKEKQRNADKKAKVTRTKTPPAGKDW